MSNTRALTYPAPSRMSVELGDHKYYTTAWDCTNVIQARLAGCWFQGGDSFTDALATKLAYMPIQELHKLLQAMCEEQIAEDPHA